MKYLVSIFLALALNSYGQTPGGGVTDIDGNTYNTVIIGTQEWQKENLNVSKYSDGTPIPQETDQTTWDNLTTGAWCYYNNDPALGAIYGKLYNWYAVAGIYDAQSLANPTLRKQLAPLGWHVQSRPEVLTLFIYLNTDAGSKLKEVGTIHWQSPNNGATNESGFTGLPGGLRDSNFYGLGTDGFWLGTSEVISTNNNRVDGGINLNNLWTFANSLNTNKWAGGSVRCVNNIALNNQSFNTNSFNIYPNPTKDLITIDCGNRTNVNGWNYKIVNTIGQEVQNGALNSQWNTVQLNNIKGQGIYFVKIYDSSNALMDTKKIIIQK